MTAGGLVGFGVLAVLLGTALSLVAVAVVALASDALHRAGAAAERRAAACALLAPVGLALATVAVLVVRGSGGLDDCPGHGHHAHLCLVHGSEWLERAWAVAVAAGAVVTIVLRGVAMAARRVRMARSIAELARVAEGRDGIQIAASDRSFCFVAGWPRPTVFMSSRAWEALSSEQRAAVIAHERAHITHGDLWLGALLELAAVFAAPLAGGWLLARWSDATERLCDASAARQRDPETVAGALVALCRAGRVQYVPSGFTPAEEALDRRVRAVLAGGPIGERAARRIGALAVLGSVAIVALVIALATILHHALETLLG